MIKRTSSIKEFLEEFDRDRERIAQVLPEPNQMFIKLLASIRKQRVLPTKVKELIALGISVAIGCETCIITHTRAAMRYGATPEEIAEAISVALFMRGGQAYAYIPIALNAAEELKDTIKNQRAEKNKLLR